MENRKAIEWFENRIAVMPESETKENDHERKDTAKEDNDKP